MTESRGGETARAYLFLKLLFNLRGTKAEWWLDFFMDESNILRTRLSHESKHLISLGKVVWCMCI